MNPALKQLYAELIAEGYSHSEAMNMLNSGAIAPQITSNTLGSVGNAAPASLGLLTRLRGSFGEGKTIGPNIGSFGNVKGLLHDVQNTNVMGLGKVKNIGTGAMGIYQGGKALKGLYDNSNKDASLTSLKNDINTSIASNPMYDMYLDTSDERTLRDLKSGNLTNGMGGALEGGVKGIPQALLSALIGGAVGGVPGAIVNGVGSLVNSGIQGYGNNLDQASGKLQGLYSKLRQADEQYRTMKRPNGLGRAGLSTQYFNQLY